MDELSIIRFNDDNHPERIFINGNFVGVASDIGNIIIRSIPFIKELNDEYRVVETSVYVCDDFEEFDEDDEAENDIVDSIWMFFNDVEEMSEEQIELIFKKDWRKLYETIRKENL